VKVLDALGNLAETLLEHLEWRRDWDRSSSPVSYWLAVLGAIAFVILFALYWSEAWEHVRDLWTASASMNWGPSNNALKLTRSAMALASAALAA
jgi:hypothetical protein